MAQKNLTAEYVRDLHFADAGQRFVYDTKLTGFGVRIGKTSKTYIAERRVKGRVRRITIAPTNTLTVKEARKAAQLLLAKMASNVDPNQAKAAQRAKGMTLGEAIDVFLSGREHKFSTASNYRNTMEREFGDWKKTELRNITPNMMLSRFQKILGRTPSGAALAMRTFRSCWNYARELTADNNGVPVLSEAPTRRVTALKLMPKPKRKQSHVTDFRAFFVALKTVHSETNSNRYKNAGQLYFCFCELLLRSGLRKSEASHLKWQDVNFSRKTFSIPAERSKNGEALTLPMSSQLFRLFHLLKLIQPAGEYVWGSRPLGDPSKSLQKTRELLGYNLNFHDLRRTFAVLAERLDVAYPKLKRMMNHSDNDVTLGYLASRDPERFRDEMQSISDEIDRLAAVSR
jgi:integrase